MTLDEAYKLLGLEPVDDFIQKMMEHNRQCGRPENIYRRIGATTWMIVSAALQIETSDVLLVSQSTSWGKDLLNQMKGTLEKLGYHATWEGHSTLKVLNPPVRQFVHLSVNSGKINPSARVVGNSFFKGIPFEDTVWKERAIRRTQGPFAMVREIRYFLGQYLAFAENDEFLFEMTRKGAEDLVKDNRDIYTKDWQPLEFFPGITTTPGWDSPTDA